MLLRPEILHPLKPLTLLLTALLLSAPAVAHDPQAVALGRPEAALHGNRSGPQQAAELLAQAVEFARTNPRERVIALFNNQAGRFHQGDLYVFAVGDDGVVLAHGGEPDGLVGMDVRGLKDASGKPFIADMLAQSRTADAGKLSYQWLNRQTNRIEPKHTVFQRVGNMVVGVGYYEPRATAEMATALLDAAVAEMGRSGADKAFARFNDARDEFVRDDLYVFVVGRNDRRFHAMGASPGMTGSQAEGLRDASGKAIIQDMLALVNDKDRAEYDYVWRNPLTNRVETKHTFLRRVGDYVVGVGTYQPASTKSLRGR